jgi:hypothetical protein
MIGLIKISNTKTDYLVLNKHGGFFDEKYLMDGRQPISPGQKPSAHPNTSSNILALWVETRAYGAPLST